MLCRGKVGRACIDKADEILHGPEGRAAVAAGFSVVVLVMVPHADAPEDAPIVGASMAVRKDLDRYQVAEGLFIIGDELSPADDGACDECGEPLTPAPSSGGKVSH